MSRLASLNKLSEEKIEASWLLDEQDTLYSDTVSKCKVVSKENQSQTPVVDTLGNEARLQYFQAFMFSTVMEDAISQLRLLSECNNELRIINLNSNLDALLRKKFRVQEPEITDELAAIDPEKLSCDQYKLSKLAADRKFVNTVLTENYQELSLNTNFNTLKKFCNQITAKEVRYNFLMEDVTNNKCIRRDLYKQLRQQRNHIKSAVYDTEVVIDGLKATVEDSILVSETRERYISNWQRARSEQHTQAIHDQESVPSSLISYYKQRHDNEERVHAEAETLTHIFITETLQKVEDWMTKYETDMEAIDLKIRIQKNDFQVTRDKRRGLEDMIEKHDQLIKDWIHFKEEREKARQYVVKMTKSAITVQAWWRGLLVRLMLGPYRPPKKGKGKGKK